MKEGKQEADGDREDEGEKKWRHGDRNVERRRIKEVLGNQIN